MPTASFLYQKLVDRSTLRQGFSTLSFDFPNGLTERVQQNKHLLQA